MTDPRNHTRRSATWRCSVCQRPLTHHETIRMICKPCKATREAKYAGQEQYKR